MTTHSHRSRRTGLDDLGLVVIQRDWLSANHIVFGACDGAPATVVDTGYGRHSAMTLALVDHALAGSPVKRVINTHLHSDHCGGNHALQARDACVEVLVPAASHEAAHHWDAARLSYVPTGQCCERFRVDGALADGEVIRLGTSEWQVHAAPGHDPDAVMLFEPRTKTLIAGDALWEDRLAIIFPELAGLDGFGPTASTLNFIESLDPKTVIPGHGPSFSDVGAALQASRKRLSAFARDPQRHVRHAARALLMFHLMEVQSIRNQDLHAWLGTTPIFLAMASALHRDADAATWAQQLIEGLLDDGLLALHQDILTLAESSSR